MLTIDFLIFNWNGYFIEGDDSGPGIDNMGVFSYFNFCKGIGSTKTNPFKLLEEWTGTGIGSPVIAEIVGHFFSATATVLNIVLMLYMWIIIIRALLSWVNPDPNNPIVQFLYSITEPVLYRVRRLVPMSGIGIDFSPIIVLLLIIFCQEFLVNSLHLMGQRMQGPP